MLLLGSYFRVSGCSAPSNDASAMSMGDWRGPSAIGNPLTHVLGPLKLYAEK